MAYSLFDYLIFYCVFIVLLVNFITKFWKTVNPLYLTGPLSFIIYFGVNYQDASNFESYLMLAFNSLTIFAGIVGISKLFEPKSDKEKKEMISPERKYKGLSTSNSEKRPFFYKWF
ncbi:hypothetical protein Q4Q34_08635 [Flavivirga abyssicola]|uniref:hypothetical protein n=1 Tax=Flavivirga abyssicola TaxID=3063533 RepID=UPI0026DF26AB|nr:hypothetical protein [Flavivirga sp. MEBiC07777]WVK15093.1 hypothetical protein Q4Q34_08635 [Flavivirga sp. MEBiC07777]